MDVNGEQQGEYACLYWGLKGLKAVVHLEYCTLLKEIYQSRENEGTERDAQGVGRDMSCPRKLFLDEWKSGFRDVRRQHCLALRFLVKRENGDIRGRLVNIYIHHVFSKGN